MKFIRSIDIRYFRSLYHIRLTKLRPVNLFSGRNDTGKSNILRALNLFFNRSTDWQEVLDFYRDFSRQRLDRVREQSIKGKQFISIAVEFFRPNAYKGSLPELFTITRTWHRYADIPTETNNLEWLYKQKKLPGSLETARRFLPNFLNRIHFEYVPAVKDRLYFEHLLSRLQKALLDTSRGADPTISGTADHLAKHVQNKILLLQSDFKRATGIDSFIVPPRDIGSLFQAFLVSTESRKDQEVPLSLRGDGIQGRYVWSVLRYICENSTDFFIWGFEEPENSLEYARVVELAKDIENVYSKIAQIFLTTHSAALTSLHSDDITCWRVFQEEEGWSNIAVVWPESGSSEERTKLNIEMGFLKIQEDMHKEYITKTEELGILQNNMNQIVQEASQKKLPIVLCEGKHDCSILKTAWKKLRTGLELNFILRAVDPSQTESASGSGGVQFLAKAIETVHPAEKRKMIGVFDRDHDGRKAFDSLSRNFKRWQNRDDIKVHLNGLAFAILLPIPPGREAYSDHKNLSIEFLFPDEALNMKTADGKSLTFQTPSPIVMCGNARIKIDSTMNQLNLPLDSCRKIVSGKDVFATEIVLGLAPIYFQSFEVLFKDIDQIIKS